MLIIMNTKFIYTLSSDYYSINLDKLSNKPKVIEKFDIDNFS